MFIKTEIRESQIDREGVFTLEIVPKGKILSIWRNITLHEEEEYNARVDDRPFRRNAVRIIGRYYGYQEGGTVPEDYINHSDNPNVLYFMGILIALKDIQCGEELLVDYNYYFGLRNRFKDVQSGNLVTGLSPRECMLQSCQQLIDLLEDIEDWDGM
jgi:SET domain-containing protein